jgi:O-antigen ligase
MFYAGFAVFVAMTIRDRFAISIVAFGLLVSAAVIACLAIALEVSGVYLWREGVLNVLGRANATFGDPNILARFLLIALITLLAIVALPRRPDRRVDIALCGCVIVLAAALVLTQSRFAWITLVVILPLLIISLRRRRALLGYCAVFVLAFVAVSAVNGTAVGRAGEFAAGVSHSLGGDVSITSRGNLTGPDDVGYTPPRKVLGHELFARLPIDDVRYYLLEAGVAMWEDHPVVGLGVGGFQPNLLGTYRGFIPRDRIENPPSLPHTFLAQIAAENGVVGLIVVGVFLGVLASMAWRASRSGNEVLRTSAIATALSILTIFLSSQVAGGFLVEPYLWLAVGVLAGVYRLTRRDARAQSAD